MLELSSLKKNKVNLTDYNSQQDIENRMMLADFTVFEHRVLEEILFSSLKISLRKFSKSIGCSEEELMPVLEKLVKAGLLTVDDDIAHVDKDMRKYFECQNARFDLDFKPDMEFLQGLLRKVPIHVLPTWYAIPRTSSNIFESILEKYLLSPQIFTRYLGEFFPGDGKVHAILRDVYTAPNWQISSSDLIARYNLSRYEFEEMMIWLEFNFLSCLFYVKEDDHWIEYVSPFYEWRQYQLHQQTTDPLRLNPETVLSKRQSPFAFVEDLSKLLQEAKKQPIDLSSWNLEELMPVDLTRNLASKIGLHTLTELSFAQNYLTEMVKKLFLLKLAELHQKHLLPSDSAHDWLQLSLENKASYLHRHPLNQILSYPVDPFWNKEKYIHEAEKSVKKVLHGDWVCFDDFLKSVLVCFDENSVITLKKTGKTWRYTIPQYTEEQKLLIKAVVFEWLFEAGMVSIGTAEGRECFRVTDFGRCFF